MKFDIIVSLEEMKCKCIKGIVYKKMKILSLITHDHVVPTRETLMNEMNLCSSSEHKLRYFWWNPRASWPSIDSKCPTMIQDPERYQEHQQNSPK